MPKPTEEEIDRIITLISRPGNNYQHFFDNLLSPDWLKPLAVRGLFKEPPGRKGDPETTHFRRWSASSYLVRMAQRPAAQPQVLAIVEDIPETANIYVQHDIIEIALQLPAADSVRLCERILTWVTTGTDGPMKDRIADLVVHLAEGNEFETAMRLTAGTLSLAAPVDPETQGWRGQAEPSARLDKWQYDEFLKKAVPVLSRHAPAEVFDRLCALLRKALAYSTWPDDGWDDPSFLIRHREALEVDRTRYDLIDSVLAALLNCAETILAAEPTLITTVLASLRKRKLILFRRLELVILGLHSSLAVREVSQEALQVARLEEPELLPDSARFLRRVFPSLDPDTQIAILEEVNRGPSPVDVRRWLSNIRSGHTLADEENLANQWRFERLALFRGSAPPGWEQRIEEGAKLATAPTLDEPTPIQASWVGPASPLTQDELDAMSPKDIAEYLRDWRPSEGFESPSPEGLGRLLAKTIPTNPGEFASQAALFSDLDPTYIRFYFAGIQEVARQGTELGWDPILELASWVINQDRDAPGRTPRRDSDPDWGWTRKQIASLLGTALGNEAAPVPFVERDRLWHILSVLAEDPDPSVLQEDERGGNTLDPATLSINTVRPSAFHAIIQFALWAQRDPKVESRTFEDLPEIRQVLVNHLDPNLEPTKTVRAVFGWHFQRLLWLDESWTREFVPMVFPPCPEQAHLWAAAWESYLVFCRPTSLSLRLLRSQYCRATNELGVRRPIIEHPAKSEERLADHLLDSLAVGFLDRVKDADLIEGFFARASDELRGHATAHVGYTLGNAARVEPEVLARLIDFWDWRLREIASANSPGEFDAELCGFEHWFVAEKFDRDEVGERLLLSLELATRLDLSPDFWKCLQSLAISRLKDALQVIRLALVRSHEGWSIYAGRESIKEIILAGRASPDGSVVELTRKAASELLAKGYTFVGSS